MKSRFMTFAALFLACVFAAGGGAYIAVRQSQSASGSPVVSEPAAAGQSPVAKAAPAGIVTTPPAVGDTAAVQPTPAPSAPAQPTVSAEPRRIERPARSARNEAREKGLADKSGADVPAEPGSATPAPQAPAPPDAAPVPAPQSVTQPPAEPQREWVDVEVPAESVLGLQIQTTVSSETARVEDRVDARITRDVRVGDRVAVPAGSQAQGTVVQVDRGGKMKDAARIAIRFNSLILPDGTRLPITAEAVHREGPSPANKTAAKIGGATVGGAILGAILGGGKGAAIGGAIGAGGGTAASMAGEREPATLPAGSIVNIRLMSPVTVTLER